MSVIGYFTTSPVVLMRRWEPLQECTSDFYAVGSTAEEACCYPVITELFYNQGAIPPGDAGNPLYLYGCGNTLFTGYIDSGPYQVINGIINYGVIVVCPICPSSCECFEIWGPDLLVYASWTDCCGDVYTDEPIQSGAKLCLQLNRDGSPTIQFSTSGDYTATGDQCECGQSCGR